MLSLEIMPPLMFGGLVVFLLIVVVHARAMARIDAAHGLAEDD